MSSNFLIAENAPANVGDDSQSDVVDPRCEMTSPFQS